jgi:hypothetical protein
MHEANPRPQVYRIFELYSLAPLHYSPTFDHNWPDNSTTRAHRYFKMMVDNITLKVLSMKDFILEHLGKLFDLMITFEFTRTLKNILREYAVGLKESDLNDIITEKALDTQNLPKNLVDILVGLTYQV